jgi:hypothetical protein
MAEKKQIRLLNLAGELSPRLLGFFGANQVEVVQPELLDDIKTIQYILVADVSDFADLNNRYDTMANHIHVLSLTPIADTKDFLLAGGRGILDESWLDTKVGTILMQKLFQSAGTIHLDELFGDEFKQYETCKLSSHLRLGHYTDLISMDAFDNDFNIVAIRGFIYHAIYYYTYLKQAGIGSIPFEIEYTYNDNFFVVHMHMPVKNFVAEYLLDCFGEDNTTDPLKYLLKTSSRLADNMDVTYIENPAKLVITGVWKKVNADRVYMYNQLLLSNIKTSKHILDDLDKSIAKVKVIDGNIDGDERVEGLDKKPLPGNIVEMVLNPGNPDSTLNKQPQKAAALMAHIVATAEEQGKQVESLTPEEIEQMVGNFSDEEFVESLTPEDKKNLYDKIQKKNIVDAYEEEVQRVKGELDQDEKHVATIQEKYEEDISQRVSQSLDVNAINQLISEAPEEEEEKQAVGGDKYGLDLDAFTVKDSGITEDGEKITVHDGGITEDGEKITVHGDKDEDKSSTKVSGESLFKDDSVTVKEGATEEDDKITVHGSDTEEDEDGIRIKDVTDKSSEEAINVAGGSTEDENKITVHDSGADEDEDAINITGDVEEDPATFKVDGSKDEQDPNFQVGSSNFNEDDDQTMAGRLSGMPDDDKVGFTVSGVTQNMDDERNISRLQGQERENVRNMFDNAFDMTREKIEQDGGTLDFASMMDNMKRYLAEQGMDPALAEQVLKSTSFFMQNALENQVVPEGGRMEELTADYLNDFKKKSYNNAVNEALDKIIVREPDQAQDNELDFGEYFKKKFSGRLSEKLADYVTEEDGTRRNLTEEDFYKKDVQEAIQQSLQTVFHEEMQVVAGGDQDKFMQMEEQAIKSLAGILPIDEEMLKQMAHQSTEAVQGYEVEAVVDNIFQNANEDPLVIRDEGIAEELAAEQNEVQGISEAGPQSFDQQALLQKVKQYEVMNKKLQEDMKNLKVDVNAKDNTIKQLQNMTREAKMANVKLSSQIPKRADLMTEGKREELKKKIAEDPNLDPADAELMAKALDREKRLLDITKKAELELRKYQIEARQKETKMTQEVEKINRLMSSKDVVIDKAKEQLVSLTEKKNTEIKKLNQRLSDINKSDAASQSKKALQDLKKMEKENQNLQKMVDLYKGRAATGKGADAPSKSPDMVGGEDTQKFRDQVKHLEAVKKKLEQKLMGFERNNSSLTSKLKDQQTATVAAQKEKDKIFAELKQARTQLSVLDVPNQDMEKVVSQNTDALKDSPSFSPQEKMRMQGQLTDAQKKLKDFEGKVKLLEKKAQEGQKAEQKAKILTAKEDQLKKELSQNQRKLQSMQEKLSQLERKTDFRSDDVIGNEQIDKIKLSYENEKKKAAEMEAKSKKLEKELQKALLNQFKDAKSADKKDDPVAQLKANEAKLKLQLMDSQKKSQFTERRLKEAEKKLAEIEGREMLQESNDDGMIDTSQAIPSARGGNPEIENKLKKELESSRTDNKKAEARIKSLSKTLMKC